MPLAHQVRFLRDGARRLREIAKIDANSLARELREMAVELEQEAGQLERQLEESEPNPAEDA